MYEWSKSLWVSGASTSVVVWMCIAERYWRISSREQHELSVMEDVDSTRTHRRRVDSVVATGGGELLTVVTAVVTERGGTARVDGETETVLGAMATGGGAISGMGWMDSMGSMSSGVEAID
jgi:hypothetical protein